MSTYQLGLLGRLLQLYPATVEKFLDQESENVAVALALPPVGCINVSFPALSLS